MAGVHMSDGCVHPGRHAHLLHAWDGMILIPDQVEGRPAPPCRLRQRASQGGAVDRPLRGVGHDLRVLIEILREQLEHALAGEFEKAFRVRPYVCVQRGGLELREQRPRRFPGVRRESVDIDEAGDLRIISLLFCQKETGEEAPSRRFASNLVCGVPRF